MADKTISDTSEAATGAESTYVSGEQRPLENPPKTGAPDASRPVAQELSEMHVDSKLSAGQVAPSAIASPMVGKNEQGEPVDQYGRTQADLDALAKRRDEANVAMDQKVQDREVLAQAVTDVAAAARDRSIAVQEEVGTRERDGVTIGTPAFERRKAAVNEILNNTIPATDADAHDRSHADRLQELAASLHMASPAGIETIQHQMMALATEMRDGKPKPKPTPAKTQAQAVA